MRRPFVTPVALLVALLAVLVALLGVVAVPSPADAAPVVKRRYVVVFQPGSAASGVADAIRSGDDVVERTLTRVFPGAIVELNDNRAEAWARHPNVTFLEPETPLGVTDTQSSAPWGLDRIDQADRPLDGSFTYPSTASGVRAYVVDTGIVASHPEFGGRVAGGFTAVDDGAGTTDCNGHGTHVAGSLGGATYGVAKQVTLVPVRVLDCNGSGTSAGVIAGLDWVLGQHTPGQAAVVNMSLGGGPSSTLDQAVSAVIAAGVTVVVAAGNAATDACDASPARVAAALTVAASTSTDTRASFSNTGSCVDLFAPGDRIVSAWKDGGTANLSGTSMAAPHVAGAAALAMATSGSTAPSTIHAAIVAAAVTDRLGDVGTGTPNRLLSIGGAAAPAPDTAVPDAPGTPSTSDPDGAVTVPAPSTPGAVVEVRVPLTAGTARLRFSGLTGAGSVAATERAGRPSTGGRGLTLPNGYTAFAYTGQPYTSVEVCMPASASSQRLFHFPTSGGRADVTARTTSDPAVCGTVADLSAFGVGSVATIRLAGADRYATAVAVSTFRQSTVSGVSSPIVYLATGENAADALAAGAAAAAEGGVILLTRRASLPESTRQELLRRSPRSVVAVGGAAAISDAVLDAVRATVPGATVTRVFGATRYATATEVSQRVFGPGVGVVYVATGVGFADALAGAAAAGRERGPMLLVPPSGDALPAEVQAELSRLAPQRVVVLGGLAAVSAPVAAAIAAAVPGVAVTRIAGVDRFDTAAQVVDYCESRLVNAGTVFLATGAQFADALAAAAVAGGGGCPLLITRPDGVPAQVREALERLQPGRIVVLGGTAAIDLRAELELAGFLPA